ncbi:MAG: hypothetical protein HQ581_08415 [Planctomycetes bacterium]|nr:hypothetical protein [Planctomycetota bacterium]
MAEPCQVGQAQRRPTIAVPELMVGRRLACPAYVTSLSWPLSPLARGSHEAETARAVRRQIDEK